MKKYLRVKNSLCIFLFFSFSSILTNAPSEKNIEEINRIIKRPGLQHESASISFKDEADTLLLIYISAVNNLKYFARKNMLELIRLGSQGPRGKRLRIALQLDTTIERNQKITLRYYVEKNKLILTNSNDATSHKMDSGDPQTLISCCKWAIENFPAKRVILVLWNHGTGIIDIGRPRAITLAELFSFNPKNNMLELDRKVPFLDFMTQISPPDQRGICFDDITGNYITNQDLAYALDVITKNHLKRKFDIIAFDACLMSMLEVANIIKPYTDYMVASQEVELGTGYNYEKMFSLFKNSTPDPRTLSTHMVHAYEQTYINITRDYTHSAIDVKHVPLLENTVNHIAQTLITCLKNQKNNSVKKAIQMSSHKLQCTHFDEPSYKDLGHFLLNIQKNMGQFKLNNRKLEREMKSKLNSLIKECLNQIKGIVFANKCGKNLAQAQGISVYLPLRRIHNSYRKTTFWQTNAWGSFLQYYLRA